MSTTTVSFPNEPTGDVRSYVQPIRSSGRGDDAQALESLQEQIDALRAQLADGVQISLTATGFSEAEAVAAGFRRILQVTQELTEDTEITADPPQNERELLFVRMSQDSTGGWNVTWDVAVFIGGPTELGVTAPDTRYLVCFVAQNLSGLKWVKFSEQLAF